VSSLLLDTHVALWLLVDDRKRVPEQVIDALEDGRNQVALSAVSVWEIAVKRSIGKLTLEESWAQTLSGLGFDPMPVTALHAQAVEHLPWHHGDPFDRLLVAQAAVERRTLVTADQRLAAYGVEVFW
jgi:PIN domain nuclease of toxin-antitoxin system